MIHTYQHLIVLWTTPWSVQTAAESGWFVEDDRGTERMAGRGRHDATKTNVVATQLIDTKRRTSTLSTQDKRPKGKAH